MSTDELRERILASQAVPVEADLLRRLRSLPHVHGVRSVWFHGWLEITVELDALDWDARAQAIFEADDFARENLHKFSVHIHCDVPEFTRPTHVGPR